MQAVRIFSVIVVAAVWIAATSFQSAQAAPPIAGPQTTAAQIRALRGATAGPVRRLVFSDSDGGDLIVDLAGDYVRVAQKASDDVFDFKLRRRFALDADKRTFANISLYAEPAFRVAEFQNRVMMGKMLSAAGIPSDKAPMTDFVIQTQIGLTVPGVPLAKIDIATESDSTKRFRNDGKEIGHVRFGEARFTPEEKTAFGRFLRRSLTMHPTLSETIFADGRVPAEFSFDTYIAFDVRRRTLMLKSSEGISADYPLAPGSAIDLAPFEGKILGLVSELMPVMTAAVSGKANDGPRTVADYHAAVRAAHAKGDHLQVMVLVLELGLQHGSKATQCAPNQAGCEPLTEIMRAAWASPATRDLQYGLSYEGKDAAKGVPYLRKVERKGLSNPYVLDVFLANNLGDSAEAPVLFANGIRGNPYVAPFYKDFGDYFYRGYEAIPAWLLYDLGRSLPDAGKTPMLDPIDAIEKRLAQDFPQFF